MGKLWDVYETQNKKENNVSKIFLVLAVLYITLILISNILANRLIMIFNISLTGAVLLFPFTYILGDIFTEVYGFKQNKTVIWMSFICNLIMVISFLIVINMPYPENFTNSKEFKIVLGTTPRVLFGSLLGFLLGGFLNSIVLSKLKVVTKGKYLAFRTIMSTIIGETVDTLIFIVVVFMGKLSSTVIANMIFWQSTIKILIEILFIPITYKVIGKIKNMENKDAYDIGIKYRVI